MGCDSPTAPKNQKTKSMKVYQPYLAINNVSGLVCYGGMPEELQEFMAFPSRSDCKEWLERNDYDPDDYIFVETDEERIDGLMLVDGYGDFLDGTGSVSAYNSGMELDRMQERLFKTIENRIGDRDRIYLNHPLRLWEDKRNILENHGYNPDLSDEDRQDVAVVASVDREHAYDEDGTVYPLGDIVDLDDIEELIDSVLYDC